MDLFINFADARKEGFMQTEYVAEEQLLKVFLGRYKEKDLCIEVHGVENADIVNENTILRGYKLSKEERGYIFKKTDDDNNSLYALIFGGQQEQIPFYECSSQTKRWKGILHYDCSTYHGIWFVNKTFLLELNDSYTFGIAVPEVNRRNDRIEGADKQSISYFYEFTKVPSDEGASNYTWNFVKNCETNNDDGLYMPIIPKI